MSSLAKVNKSLGAHFLDTFSVILILWFLDIPKYSDMFDYIKGRRPAVYFKNQKNRCISSLRPFQMNLHVVLKNFTVKTRYRPDGSKMIMPPPIDV